MKADPCSDRLSSEYVVYHIFYPVRNIKIASIPVSQNTFFRMKNRDEAYILKYIIIIIWYPSFRRVKRHSCYL